MGIMHDAEYVVLYCNRALKIGSKGGVLYCVTYVRYLQYLDGLQKPKSQDRDIPVLLSLQRRAAVYSSSLPPHHPDLC